MHQNAPKCRFYCTVRCAVKSLVVALPAPGRAWGGRNAWASSPHGVRLERHCDPEQAAARLHDPGAGVSGRNTRQAVLKRVNASSGFAEAVALARGTGEDERTFRLWLPPPIPREASANGQGTWREAAVLIWAAVSCRVVENPPAQDLSAIREKGLQRVTCKAGLSGFWLSI